ncbi:MAG: HAMP domain-containing protein [Chloroflexi bacterium]|nr:HAMP domain-containing protein [Chloroflexota bacterium]
MSLRLRLSLSYAGLLGIVLVVFSVVLYLTMAKILLDEVDSRLRLAASQVHMSVGAADERHDLRILADTVLGAPLTSELAAPGLTVQVLDERGRLVASSPNLKNEQLPVDPALVDGGLRGEQSVATLAALAKERVRVLTMPLTVNAKVLGIVQVGQSLHDTDIAVARLRLLLIAGSLATIVAAGIVGWFLARRGLKPIGDIADAAREIGETADFGRRIDVQLPGDEVGRLATTFNDMIERIEESFESQKRFVADSSHELRTPLTVIRGNVDLLKRPLGNEDRRECLSAIESEAERMSNIVAELLLLARLDSAQEFDRQPVELDTLLLEVYRQAKVMAQGRRLLLGHEDCAVVTGDPGRLRQVLYNLVDNATKYSGEEATITLSLHRLDGWVRVDVADTGVGIAAEDLPHIFDRFYRVDKARSRATGGTGLGLTVVKQIAEAHGGKVTVSSALGKGSTFSVWLPLT